MRSLHILFTGLLISIANLCNSQTPQVVWQKSFGGPGGDYAYAIQPTKDGGYILAGSVESSGGDILGDNGNEVGDLWVVKLNAEGKIDWQKCLGGTWADFGADIHPTPDGGYIVAGSSNSIDCPVSSNRGMDYWVIKLSSLGDIEWQKKYGGSKNDYAYSISLTNDGGYTVVGTSESSDGDMSMNYGSTDYWVIKIDAMGNLLWQKTVGGSGDDAAYSVQATPDGGCVVAGYTTSTDGNITANHGKSDIWIVKFGNGGSVEWQKCLGGSSFDECRSIQLTPDGGYIITGSAASNDGDVSGNHHGTNPGNSSDLWVAKLSNIGTIQWQKCYGGSRNDQGNYIQLTSDGGYIICGISESDDGDLICGDLQTNMLMMKISSNGSLQWEKSLGGVSYEQAFSIQPLNDGSYIVCGSTCSRDIAGYHPQTAGSSCSDYLIVKLSPPLLVRKSPVVKMEPNSGSICVGNNATFEALVTYAGTNPVYQWEKNGRTVGSNSSSYTASNFVNNDVLTCRVTSGGECGTVPLKGEATLVIQTNSKIVQPQLSITVNNSAICDCTPVKFKASVSNGGLSPVYVWKLNNTITGVNSNEYVSKTLKPGDIIQCNLFDNTGCIQNEFAASNLIIMGSASSQQPSIRITPTASPTCKGSSVSFNAMTLNAGLNPSFQWRVNGINAGSGKDTFTIMNVNNRDIITCSVIVDPLFSCANITKATSNAIEMLLTDKATPSVVIKSSADTICQGGVVTFTATLTNGGTAPFWQWKINGVNAGTNSSSFTTSTLVNGDIVSCTLVIDPLFTCVDTTEVTSNKIVITLSNRLSSSVTITASHNEVCKGNTITFTALAKDAGIAPLYQWVLNNVPVNNNSSVFSNNSFSNGDSLFCLIFPGNGACTLLPVASNIIVTRINDLPTISISPKDTVIITGNQVRLSATVSSNVNSWLWVPAAKLTNPQSLTPLSIPLIENTTYILKAKTNKDCQSQAAVIVKVGMLLNMPKAFTPNGDGVNDIYRIPPQVLLTLKEFSIYDRWGTRVFVTANIKQGWDGTFNGKYPGTGSFVYIINGSDYRGPVSVKGSFIMIR